MNTTQSVIARLEGGKHFPSLQTIHKYSIAVNKIINLHVRRVLKKKKISGSSRNIDAGTLGPPAPRGGKRVRGRFN